MKYPHFQYFVALCDDLERTARYVEISPENYDTFSIEYAHLLLAAGSEIDVVAKMICNQVITGESASNIDQYRKIILSAYPSIPSLEVSLPRHAITLSPWSSWTTNLNPGWWSAYNNVKHHRNTKYQQANLENTLGAVAGLCVMVAYLHWKELYDSLLEPMPSLLFLDRKYGKPALSFSECIYELPNLPRNPKITRKE
jgi:hypothetical protein